MTGIYYKDTFLKKEIVQEEIHYKSKGKHGDAEIIVKGKGRLDQNSKAEVIFNFPDGVSQQYIVYFNGSDKGNLNNVEIKDSNENSLFAGKYIRNSIVLYDEYNKPFYDDYIKSVIYAEGSMDTSDHKVPYKEIVELSLLEKDRIRGDIKLMAVAVMLIVITFVDIKWPLFLFKLSYFLSVENPQPTELYISMQKISWVLFSVMALILLLTAI